VRATALAALSLVLLGCGTTSTPTAATTSAAASSSRTSPVISPRTGPQISPAPVTPTAPGDLPDKFVCADASGGAANAETVTRIAVGQNSGFDRFVMQFGGAGVPTYTVKRQAKPVFTQGPSGQPVTLTGTSGVLITVHGASEAGTYNGATDFATNYPAMKEARLTEDFEGVVSWGIGLGSAACMRIFTYSEPARLIVDFQTSSS
jgi:hypothetical protein